MLTPQDIADIVRRHLPPGNTPGTGVPSSNNPASYDAPRSRLPALKGREFLSEYVIKKALTPGEERITIPKDAIISPLAADWLILKGIKIIRSTS